MIIDCHAHVYALPKIKHAGYATTFMSMQDQIALMDAKGIDQTVILPINNAETCAECQSIGEILYICQQYPGRFIPFCNIDPRLPRRPDLITTADFDHLLSQYQDLGCQGLGEVTARVPFDYPPLWHLFEACQKLNFPVTFHTITEDVNSYGLIDEIGLPRFEKTLRQFPQLNFFGHSPGFWSEISGDLTPKDKTNYPQTPVKPGGKLKQLFRTCPNLYGDLSAGSGLNALQRDPQHAYEFIDEFQDRLLLGLDYCSVKNDMQHIEWLTEIRDQHHITPQAYDKIMYHNISRLLNLNLP